jgi:CRISPR/Cas system-associated endonuclease Cas3-HD
MGKLSEKFQKPWGRFYSTEMFSKWFWDMEGKELVVLEKGIGFSL